MNKQLAKITSARLEIQDRGILSFYITVNYEEGGSQNIGGITLDNYCKEIESRVGTAYGCEVIRRLLIELGVNDFSEMKDKQVWILGKGEGFSFEPKGISALSTDKKDSKPVIFDEVLSDMNKLEQGKGK